MTFDLGEYKRNTTNTADIAIQHPVTGEDLGITIQVLSPDSDEYRKAALQLQNENIRYIRKNRGKTTAERISQEAMDLLVAITQGWSGVVENGQPVPFSPDNVRRVYTEYPFIKEQVDEFTADRRNFMKS